MADNLIPEPSIQATNIPSGGGARVRLDFTTPDSPFLNLSKTLANAAQTTVNFRELENRERKSREAWQEQLKQIHGLTETGQLSEADYMKIQREANAKAQKEGIIRAHENWSTMSAVQQERSKIRAEAYAEHMNDVMPSLSNPSPDFATTFEEEEGAAFEALSDFIAEDSQGNPVTLDMAEMTPMEMVYFSKQKAAVDIAARKAIEDLKEKRSVEASTARFSADMAENLFQLSMAAGYSDDDIGDIARLRISAIENVIAEAKSAGVSDINKHIFEATDTFLNFELQHTVRGGDFASTDRANRLIDMLQSDLQLWEGMKFAETGTKNFNTLEDKRASFMKSANAKHTNYLNNLPDEEEKFNLWLDTQLREFEVLDGEAELEAQRRLLRDVRAYAGERGVVVKGAHTTKISTFFSDEVADVVDTTALDRIDVDLYTGVISEAERDDLITRLVNEKSKGSLTQAEFASRLDKVRSRYDSQTAEEQKAANDLQVARDAGAKTIREFDARELEKELSKALATAMDESIAFGARDVLDTDALKDLIDLQGVLLDAVVNGKDIKAVPDYSLKDLAILEDAPALKSSVELMQKGLVLSDTDDIHSRSQEAVRYLMARVALNAHIQASELDATASNTSEIYLNPQQLKPLAND